MSIGFFGRSVLRALFWPFAAWVDIGYYLRNAIRPEAYFQGSNHKRVFTSLGLGSFMCALGGGALWYEIMSSLKLDLAIQAAIGVGLYFILFVGLSRLYHMRYFFFDQKSWWFSHPAAFGMPIVSWIAITLLGAIYPGQERLVASLLGTAYFACFIWGGYIKKYAPPKSHTQLARKGM